MPNVNSNGQVWPKTDLDLNTSPNLPECPITEGMDPNSLSPATRAALTHGFQTNVDNDFDDAGRHEECYPTATDPRGTPVSGFVRPEAFRKESFLPV